MMRRAVFIVAAIGLALLPWFWLGASAWAALMSLPWLALLPALIRGGRRAQQASALLSVPYFVHATTLLVTGEDALLASLELILTGALCTAAIGLGRVRQA